MVEQQFRRWVPGMPGRAGMPLPIRSRAPTNAVADRRGRLEFLDALRGIAALVVAVQHIGEEHWVGMLGFSTYWFRVGEFGILLFFFCSGFIIPASLERRNDLVDFWIGRVFRLWPLYLLVVGIALTSWAVSARLHPPTGFRPLVDGLVNLTMLQVFTTRPLVIGASWTLGYELVFYLAVSVLFLFGVHRCSSVTASVLLVASLGLGGVTTTYMLQQRPEHWWSQPVAALILVALATTRLRSWAARAASVGMSLVVIAVLANRPHPAYFDLLVLACMFVGTVLYRWTAGQTSGRAAATVYGAAVAVILITQRTWHHGYTEPVSGLTPQWWTEAGTFMGAALVFGAALLLRRHRWPRVLTYLGAISYSIYLVHALVLLTFPPIPGPPWVGFVVMLASTLAISILTYHLVEQPAIKLGRRVAAARRRRVAHAG
jgi:peptidoglycan/LPS O-acetylase OafA/YrhL